MSRSRPSGYSAESSRILRDDPGMRAAVTAATRTFDDHRRDAWTRIDADAWRSWAEGVKSHLLTHLDTYLEQAEEPEETLTVPSTTGR